MNTYFDIRRFGRLMRYDLVANSRHLAFLLIAVSVGLYALLFLNFYKAFTVTYSVGEMESRVGDIASFFLLVLFVFSVYSPSLVCSRLCDKAASTAYWLLPASPLEKFLVRFLLSAFGAVGLVVCAMLLLARALKLKLGRRNVILLGCAFLSFGAMILSPHYPDRACFGTMVLLICVALRIGGRIARERKDMAIPLFAVSVLVWLRGMYFLGEFLAISWGWIR